MPDGPFDLILCRNLVFTYLDEALQCRLTAQLHERLLSGGYVVFGSHEGIPAGAGGFARLAPNLPIYRAEPLVRRGGVAHLGGVQSTRTK